MAKLFSAWEEPEEPEQEQEAAEEAVDQFLESFGDEDVDEQMSEAEKRLALASYYKQLAKGGIFDDGTEEAAIVDDEVRQFAKLQMAKLLNLGGTTAPRQAAAPVELPFSDKEVVALKAVAKRILAQQGEVPSEPAIKKVEPPKVAQPRPPAPPAQPKRRPPAPAKQPQKPATKPATKKPATGRRAAPGQQSAAKPQDSEPEVLTEDQLPRSEDGTVDYEAIPTEQVFLERGNRYKMVPHPSEDNKRLKLNVNRQTGNPRAKPMPTQSELEMIQQIQTNQQLRLLDDADQTIHVAAATSLMQK